MSIPTYTYTQVDGVECVTSVTYSMPNGACHRVDGPAWQKWEIRNGVTVLTDEAWLQGNKPHRIDGPARRTWEIVDGFGYDIPFLTYEVWYLEGEAHRVDGPARRRWVVKNRVTILTDEEWWLEGKLHRVDGPAIQQWTIIEGKVALACEAWYVEGRGVKPSISPSLRAMITHHLHACGLVIWPGLMDLIIGYLV